jgi:hypothetical protein
LEASRTGSPRCRKGLITHSFPDETLVYDLRNDRAMCLNAAASLVFSLCDGETDPSRMADVVEKQLGVADGAAVVELALEQLVKARLVERWKPTRRRIKRELAAVRPAVSPMPAPTGQSAAIYVTQRRRKG